MFKSSQKSKEGSRYSDVRGQIMPTEIIAETLFQVIKRQWENFKTARKRNGFANTKGLHKLLVDFSADTL